MGIIFICWCSEGTDNRGKEAISKASNNTGRFYKGCDRQKDRDASSSSSTAADFNVDRLRIQTQALTIPQQNSFKSFFRWKLDKEECLTLNKSQILLANSPPPQYWRWRLHNIWDKLRRIEKIKGCILVISNMGTRGRMEMPFGCRWCSAKQIVK